MDRMARQLPRQQSPKDDPSSESIGFLLPLDDLRKSAKSADRFEYSRLSVSVPGLIRLLCLGLLALAGCRPAAAPGAGAPAETLALAWEDFRMAEYNRAARRFQAVVDAAGAGEDAHAAALYGLGATAALRRPDPEPERAREFYEAAVGAAPESGWAAWSLLGLARMLDFEPGSEEPDAAKLRAAYQRVIDAFPEHPAGEEAFILQQGTLVVSLEENDARQAVENLTAYLARHPGSKYTSTIHGLVQDAYGTLEEPEHQFEAALQAMEHRELDPANPKADLAPTYWSLAAFAETNLGDFPSARKFYHLLIEEYPTDQRVYPAKLALARMDRMEAEVRARLLARKGAP